jgi:hypothetical protein
MQQDKLMNTSEKFLKFAAECAGMQALREFLVAKYPTAMSLKESDIADSSFIDELERSGFIDRLYAADTK